MIWSTVGRCSCTCPIPPQPSLGWSLPYDQAVCFCYGLWNYGGHADAPRINSLVARVLAKLAEARLTDPWFGRGLPSLILATGLELHGGEVETRVARPGEAHYEFERVNAVATVPIMIKLGIYGEAEANLLQSISGHLDSVVTTMSFVSVWGRKPL